MKRVSVFVVIGVMLFTGCHQTKAVQYNVNPDEVFGQDYTAKDFGIWYLLSYSDNLYSSLVNETMERLPEEKQIAWDNQNGLRLPSSDTAAFMNALRTGKMPVSPEGSQLIPCWILMSAPEEEMYQFNICYGDASGNPVIDSTHVKKVSVEKNDYTGRYEVLMQFDMRTADLWQKFTASNVHKRIGMMLGTDRLLSAPQIMCEIAGGACCVSGPSENECYAIATILQGNK